MHIWRKAVRAAKLVLTLILAAAAAAVLFFLWHAPAFAGGERYTLALGESSSARMLFFEKNAPLLLPAGVGGESALYAGERAEELLEAFRARVLFMESAAGTVSYYCHSPFLGEGVLLNGKEVNLHIAVGEGRTAAGTPLIFGGF